MTNPYVNTNPITIYYHNPNNSEVIDVRTIVFPTELIKQSSKTTKLFDKNKYNPIIEYDTDKKTYFVKHMNLLPWTTIDEFKYIIASVLQCDYTTIINIEAEYNLDYVVQSHDVISQHIDNVYKDIYESQTSIGYNKYSCHVNKQHYTINTPYDYKFYDNYLTITKYIQSLPNYDKITREDIIKHKSCQNIEVWLLYADTNNTPHASTSCKHLTTYPIDIVKLFNMTNINQSIKKILVHDVNLTVFNNDDREYQYIKTENSLSEPFKNTFSRFNCCSIYVVNEIYPSVILSRLEFYKTGLIKCCFIITDPDMDYEYVQSLLKTYYTDKFWKLFNKFRLDECVYDFNFDVSKYVPVYNGFSFIYTLDNVSANRFTKFVDITKQNIPTVVYKTNSSVFISSYNIDNIGLSLSYDYTNTYRTTMSDTTIRLDISVHSHVQLVDNDSVVVYFTRLMTIDELVMNAALFLPMFVDARETWNEYSPSANESANEPTTHLPIETQIDNIRKKYQKIPTKKGIKKLNEIDPILFGTRLVNDTDTRPYSALAQKKEQRVVSITKKEYDLIHDYNSDYVANIKNQTQPSQRLYLFCPWEKYPYLNFHQYHNQLCIPKCTTAITKKTQYLYCNNQLDAKGYKNDFTSDSSKMIVYYSPLLLAGRKCFPPDELSVVCENYLLYKLPPNTDVLNYVREHYGMYPLILQRDNVNKQYVLQNDIENDKDYVLIIQSELDNGYYTVLDDDNKPFVISQHTEFNNFIKSIQFDKNVGYTLLNYIDSVFGTASNASPVFDMNISQLYNKMTFSQIIKHLNTLGITFVSNRQELVGIVRRVGNNKPIYLSTPPIIYDTDTININTALSSSTLPTIDMFQDRYITKYFIDYNDQPLIKCIEYKGVFVFVQPFDSTLLRHDVNKPIIYFDYEGYLNYFMFVSSNRLFLKNFEDVQQENIIRDLIGLYMFVHLMNTTDTTLSIDNIPNITDKPTNIIYINKTPSWKHSLINTNDFMNVYNKYYTNMSTDELIEIVYNTLQTNLNIYNVLDYVSISSKIITNNTM